MYLLPVAKPRVRKTSKIVYILFQICREIIVWRQMVISTKTRKDWENPCFRWQQPRLWNNCFLWLLFAWAPNGFCSCSSSESLANSCSMSDRIIILQGKKLDKTLLFVYNACMIAVPCCGRYVMLQFCLCPMATEGGSCCRSGCGPLDAPLPNMKSVLMAGSNRVTWRVKRVRGNFFPVGISLHIWCYSEKIQRDSPSLNRVTYFIYQERKSGV